jgi:HPt (histidine-containing phosphotransfer) domain-containing protein
LQNADQESEAQIPGSKMARAPMDFARAIEEFEGDEDFLMEVVEGFVGNVESQIEIIRQAISEGDAEVVGKEAHSIKGGAGNLTADELSKIALELENIGKSGNLEEGAQTLGRLEKEFRFLKAYVGNRSIEKGQEGPLA